MKENGLKKGEEWVRNERLLAAALDCWEGMSEFRRDRERCKRFTYGDQWGDTIDVDGVKVREEDYLWEQGNMPMKNNLIRRLVRNVLGVFRNRWNIPRCETLGISGRHNGADMQELLEFNIRRNRLEEMYARTMEEFLISGLAVHRKWFGIRANTADCWTDFVQPDTFFSDAGSRDFRGWDLSLIGEMHDMDFPALAAEFARNRHEYDLLERIYGVQEGKPGDRKCRVIEVWRKEYRQHYRCHDAVSGRFYHSMLPVEEGKVKAEWVTEEEWHSYFLAPGGEVLRAGKSPYAHGGHPYVVKAYPFIDGEIHSFVSDIIDQQKFTNRLISMYDWVLRASAKGVLLFPEGSLPDGVDINDVASEWSRFNGVIVYRPKQGVPLPQQVSSAVSQNGITDLLDIQLRMMEDISGVNGALQGKLDNGSMSGTLYNQQTQNSMTALTDLLQSFDSFVEEATRMDISNIAQYYGEAKIRQITGKVA